MTTHIRKNRRAEKTNYRKRLSLLKSGIPRLVVRVSSRNISAQLVEYKPAGDVVLHAVSTRSLTKLGWKASRTNTPSAYLLGYLLAKKANVSKAILDLGKQPSIVQSRIYAVVKGALDGGLEIPVDDSVLPEESRITGEHIKTYAEKLSEDKTAYEKKFSLYLKQNIKPEELPSHVSSVKAKIEAEK